MHGVGVCAGPYSPTLVTAWKAWDATHSSENDSVADLPHDQVCKAQNWARHPKGVCNPHAKDLSPFIKA